MESETKKKTIPMLSDSKYESAHAQNTHFLVTFLTPEDKAAFQDQIKPVAVEFEESVICKKIEVMKLSYRPTLIALKNRIIEKQENIPFKMRLYSLHTKKRGQILDQMEDFLNSDNPTVLAPELNRLHPQDLEQDLGPGGHQDLGQNLGFQHLGQNIDLQGLGQNPGHLHLQGLEQNLGGLQQLVQNLGGLQHLGQNLGGFQHLGQNIDPQGLGQNFGHPHPRQMEEAREERGFLESLNEGPVPFGNRPNLSIIQPQIVNQPQNQSQIQNQDDTLVNLMAYLEENAGNAENIEEIDRFCE